METLRALISRAASEDPTKLDDPFKIMLIDVSRAHFYGESRRKVYTTLPEGYEEPGKCALLLRTMYGTEDAANIWLSTWNAHVEGCGYAIGSSNPSLFYGHDTRGLCHGDDFVLVAGRADLLQFEQSLAARFDTKRVGLVIRRLAF